MIKKSKHIDNKIHQNTYKKYNRVSCKEQQQQRPQDINNMRVVSPWLLIIILNKDRLNSSIKSDRMAE